jgi:hypothetical protein
MNLFTSGAFGCELIHGGAYMEQPSTDADGHVIEDEKLGCALAVHGGCHHGNA